MILRRFLGWCLLGLALLTGAAWGQVPVPPSLALVTDLTGTLSADQRAALEARLLDLQARKGSQLAVLIVPTVQPETVDQYAVRVVEQWKIGRKGVDDGVLLLVAKDDRRMRIEVGYGLEGAITDVASKRVIDEVLTPHFRQGDFAGGIDEAVTRLIGLIDGEALPEPPPRAPMDDWGDIGNWAPVLIIGTLVVSTVLRSIFGRFLGAGLAGGLMGFVAWSASGLLLVAGVCAAIAFAVTLLGGLGRGGGWVNRGGGHYRGGGWGGGLGGGGFGGGGFGGGGGGGGGFSGGGGGGSGGGGASGGW